MASNFLFGGIAAGVALVILLKIYQSAKSGNGKSQKEVLEGCFGTKVFVSNLSHEIIRDWLKTREDLLTASSKAAVLKVNDSALKSIGVDLKLGDEIGNMVVIAIVGENGKDIKASSLIEYERMEPKLHDLLGRDGVLVIEK